MTLHADQRPKQKPQRRELAGSSTRTFPIGERTWTDVEPGEYSFSDYTVSKKLMDLLRHRSLPRENDGAVDFWRIKDNLQKHFQHCFIGLTTSGRKAWQVEEETRKCTSIVLIHPEQFFTSELFKVIHDAISLFILQDNVVIPSNFFQCILSCRMCDQFTFHHQFGIDTWRSKFEQQTNSILSACGSHGQKP